MSRCRRLLLLSCLPLTFAPPVLALPPRAVGVSLQSCFPTPKSRVVSLSEAAACLDLTVRLRPLAASLLPPGDARAGRRPPNLLLIDGEQVRLRTGWWYPASWLRPPLHRQLKADVNSQTAPRGGHLLLAFTVPASDVCFAQMFVDHFFFFFCFQLFPSAVTAANQEPPPPPSSSLALANFTSPSKSPQSGTSPDALLHPIQPACARVLTPSTQSFASVSEQLWLLPTKLCPCSVNE